MLHAYCIRFATDEPPEEGLTGVDGEPVRQVIGGDLAIWVSSSRGAPASVDRLRQHESVVRRALRSATPLPMRFGTALRDDAHAVESLEREEAGFAALLTRFSGHLEMGVRVSYLDPRSAPVPHRDVPVERDAGGSPGRAHLEARRRSLEIASTVRQDVDDSLRRVESQLSDLALPTVRTVLAGDPPIGCLAHLVRREQLSVYRRRVVDLQRRNEDLHIAVSGPWAPYSFVK